MKRLNNKGFTLIEILITLALIVAITAVAVGSFVGISNAKKNESWSLVKNQIESAAKQYFTSNAYLYEGLKAEGSNTEGTIPVGMLVEEDYLNAVTDPRDGQAISSCAVVKVTRDSDGKYTATLDDSSENLKSDKTGDQCVNESVVEVKDPGAATGKIEYVKSDGNTITNDKSWFNVSKLGEGNTVKACMQIETKKSSVLQVKYGETPLTKTGDKYCSGDLEQGKTNVNFSIVSAGGTANYQDSVKIDTYKPNGEITFENTATGYNSNYVNVHIKAQDKTSGLKLVNVNVNKTKSKNIMSKVYDNFSNKFNEFKTTVKKLKLADTLDGSSYEGIITVTDEAGNDFTPKDPTTYNVYKDCQEGHIRQEDGTSCSAKCNGGTYNLIGYDKNSGNRCPSYDKSSGGSACNTQGCCSKTVDDGEETCGSYGSCDKNNIKSRTCTQNKKSYYDGSKCAATTRIEKGDCIPPTITVKLYKRDSNGKKTGSPIVNKSVSGMDNIIDGLGWQNSSDAPYGFVIEYSANENLNSVEWYWNKTKLTWDQAQSNTYKWDTNNHFKDGGSSNKGTSKTGEVSISAEGARRARLYFRDTFNNLTRVSFAINMDRTPPSIVYKEGPKAKSCGGQSGVYIRYEVSDSISGVNKVYHYFGNEKGAKAYNRIAGYNMNVLHYDNQGHNGPYTIERNWAVGNPSGCASENPDGPNTSWCYYNNTAVRDYAGNTSTGISSSCHKVGK